MTKKKNRTVHFYQIETLGELKFEDLLIDKHYQNSVKLDGKDIELKFIEENNNETITGTVVATKRDGIPPKHKVNTDDYTPVELEVGQGLAYPSVFLYSKKYKILLFEFNMYGAYVKHIAQYFEENYSDKNGNPQFKIDFQYILTLDTYQKIRNFDAIKKVNFKVANPTKVIQDEIGLNGPLKSFTQLAKDLNTTKSMEITLTSELIEGGIKKSGVINLLDNILKIKEHFSMKKMKNRIKVEGLTKSPTNPDLIISDEIDLFLNRLSGTFIIEEPDVHQGIQHLERKRGITEVFSNKKKVLDQIFAI